MKFRLGGRMSKNADSLPGRTEKLIPLVREAFGSGMTLYADSNSSYDVENAIRIGRLMEEYGYAFYEEPCEFDRLEDTKAVADARTQATAAAAAAGLRITGVISITESGGGYPIYAAGAALGEKSVASPVPVQTGSQQVSATVTVTFGVASA